MFSSQFREKAPLHLNLQKGRHPEFSRQKSHILAPYEIQRKLQSSGTFGRVNQTNHNLLYQSYNPVNPYPTQTLQNTEPNHQARDSFDDDAFQLAFDAAEQSVTDSATYVQRESPARTQNASENSNPKISARGSEILSSRENQERSNGSLESTSESQHGVHDADGLARTAGELLDKVKHESNPKFQKSSFLSLMRQLRDREVHVEGDKIVMVSSHKFASYSFQFPYEDRMPVPSSLIQFRQHILCIQVVNSIPIRAPRIIKKV